MSVSYASGIATISGGSSGSPNTLADIVTAVADTALCRMDDGRNFFGDIELRVTGYLYIDHGQTMQLVNGEELEVRSGGTIEFASRSSWVLTGSVSTNGNQAFQDGSTLICRRDAITGECPSFICDTGITGRNDQFSCESFDYSTLTIEGLNLYYINGFSSKIHGEAGSQIDFLTFTRDDTVTNATQAFSANLEAGVSQVFNDAAFVGFFGLGSHNGYSDAQFRLNRPTISLASDFPLNYNSGFGNATAVDFEVLDLVSGGAGDWDGTITRTTGGDNKQSNFKVLFSDAHTILDGITPVEDMRFRWVSSNATDAPEITDDSASDGVVPTQELLTALAEPGDNPTAAAFTPTKISWSARARKYDREIAGSDDLYTTKTFEAGASSTSQTTAVANLAINEAAALALTGIAFTPSGATGGTVAITSTNSAANIWASFRAWISQTANFDSDATWSFLSSVLDIGAWDLTTSVDISGSYTSSEEVILTGTALLSDGVVDHLVFDGTHSGIITLDNVQVTTLENRTGNDIQINGINGTTVGSAVATSGALVINNFLTVTDLEGDDIRVIAWDATDIVLGNEIYDYAVSDSHLVPTFGVDDVRIAVDKPGHYTRIYNINITSSQQSQVAVLTVSPNVDVTVDVDSIVSAATFTTDIDPFSLGFNVVRVTLDIDLDKVSADIWRRLYDKMTETEDGLTLLGINGLNGNDVYTTNQSGIAIVAPLLRVFATSTRDISTEAFVDESLAVATYSLFEHFPRNADNVAVISATANPVVDYTLLTGIVSGVSLDGVALKTDISELTTHVSSEADALETSLSTKSEGIQDSLTTAATVEAQNHTEQLSAISDISEDVISARDHAKAANQQTKTV